MLSRLLSYVHRLNPKRTATLTHQSHLSILRDTDPLSKQPADCRICRTCQTSMK